MNSNILKAQTRDLHDKVEKVMNSSLLFTHQFTPEHYKQLIVKSYCYIRTIQDMGIQQWSAYYNIISQKKQALLIDLKHLQLTQQDICPKRSMRKQSPHYALGLIYIVLGAMLGNKQIHKQLKQIQAFQQYPFSYLSQHQENLSEIWKDFQATINQLNQQQLQQVIQGARDGYDLFGQ